jgi:hypothetical protein
MVHREAPRSGVAHSTRQGSIRPVEHEIHRTLAPKKANALASRINLRQYAMWKRGDKMPSQKPNALMRFPCGETFDSHDYVHREHIYAKQAAGGNSR